MLLGRFCQYTLAVHSLSGTGASITCPFLTSEITGALHNVQLTPFALTQKFFHHHIFDFSLNNLTLFSIPGTSLIRFLLLLIINSSNWSSPFELAYFYHTLRLYTGMLMALPWHQWRLGKSDSSPFLPTFFSISHALSFFVCLCLSLSRSLTLSLSVSLRLYLGTRYGSIHLRLSGQSLRVVPGKAGQTVPPSTVLHSWCYFLIALCLPSPLLHTFCLVTALTGSDAGRDDSRARFSLWVYYLCSGPFKTTQNGPGSQCGELFSLPHPLPPPPPPRTPAHRPSPLPLYPPCISLCLQGRR